MREPDYEGAVAVSREFHWVGFYDREAHLHCNPYLLIAEKDAVLFDPGSIPHFPIVMRKVIDLVRPSDISVIVASHQDPDVCGNLPVLEDVINSAELKVAAHTNTIRLIRHYGLRSTLHAVDEHGFKLTLRGGRILEFFHLPFLHAPGAIATYDHKTKSLLSGDLFGAVSKDWSLFAGRDFLDPMDTFHRAYMPSNDVLKKGIERVEHLAIERILPQHGSVLEGEQVQAAIEHLKSLACGMDLIDD